MIKPLEPASLLSYATYCDSHRKQAIFSKKLNRRENRMMSAKQHERFFAELLKGKVADQINCDITDSALYPGEKIEIKCITNKSILPKRKSTHKYNQVKVTIYNSYNVEFNFKANATILCLNFEADRMTLLFDAAKVYERKIQEKGKWVINMQQIEDLEHVRVDWPVIPEDKLWPLNVLENISLYSSFALMPDNTFTFGEWLKYCTDHPTLNIFELFKDKK